MSSLFSQSQHTVMTYNLLNYPLTDTTDRNPYFRTIFSNIQPDILVTVEMNSLGGVNGFLNNVLNKVSSGYSAGTFINGPDTDNAIFFKTNLFMFLSNTPIQTALRNINEFRLKHIASGDTLIIFAVHLKANVEDSLARAAEIDSLRKRTDALSQNSYFIVLGDFNIYSSYELAYRKLKNQSSTGYFIDPINLTGIWNNGSYSQFHTQSTRTRAFGDGSTGGLDDRFDMILMSQSIMNSGGITFLPDTYFAYGNDGNHYNDSINRSPNTAVGQNVANALHYATDHLPVIASFSFDSPYLEISPITVLIEGFYNKITMTSDTVTVELRNTSAPYTLVDQAKINLNSSGQGTVKFFNALNETPYYLVIKHRNALETWSASPQTFANNTMSYDFTNDASKAFGSNLKLVGTKWCIFGGDINQDGAVNLQDLNLVFLDNVTGTAGYASSDLNGDYYTDVDDLSRVFINNVLGIMIKKPQ